MSAIKVDFLRLNEGVLCLGEGVLRLGEDLLLSLSLSRRSFDGKGKNIVTNDDIRYIHMLYSYIYM